MISLDDDNRLIISDKVQLKPYRARPFVSRQLMTEAEILAGAGGDLVLDGEFYPNYALIGFKHVQSGKYIFLEKDFNPRFLSWLLFSYRTIGFNSINYDLTMLWAAYINRNPAFLKEVSNALILGGKRKDELEREFGFKCFKLPERRHIDLINVCPLKGSLKLYAARLHCKRIQDLPFPDDMILDDWQKDVVKDYNGNDLDNTEFIFKFCKERLELRESISIEYGEDLMSKSDAQMAEVVISKEVAKLNGRRTKRPEIDAGAIYKYSVPSFLKFETPQMQELLRRIKKADFEINFNGKVIAPKELEQRVNLGGIEYSVGIGGLHSFGECPGYVADDDHDMIDVDVASFYPRIIVNLGIYPRGMGPNFLVVYDGFRLRRIDAKSDKKRSTESAGLKIFLNGVSGKWSDPFSNLYSPENTPQMNMTGQLSILMLVEMFVTNGLKVISANTDGVTVYYNKSDIAKFQYVYDKWQELTNFQLESVEYSKYFARDVNAYFAVQKDGKVKVKGPYSEVGSQSGTILDNNPITLICSDAIKKFLADRTPIEQTIFNCKDVTRFVTVRQVKGGAHKDGEYLGRVIRWAYFKNEYGTINYISNGNKVPDTEGARPLQDIPVDFPEDLDYDWYIRRCNSILEDINYIKKPRQVSFW
jgi:hypothetical protein